MSIAERRAIKKLGEIAHVYAGIPSISRGETGEIRLLTVKALNEGLIDHDLISSGKPTFTPSEKYKVRAGDVLLPSRSTFIEVAVVPRDLEGMYFNATLLAIRCNGDLDPLLLKAYLSHPVGLAEIEAVSQSGTIQMNLTARALAEIPVPVPPLAEQRTLRQLVEIADHVKQTSLHAVEKRFNTSMEIVMRNLMGKESV